MPPASTALRRAGHLAQCAVAVPLIGALAALPLPVAEGLLTGLAGVWFRLDRRRRAVAIANILRSGVAHDERAARPHGPRVLSPLRPAGRRIAENTPLAAG
jgi:hypothetical protein